MASPQCICSLGGEELCCRLGGLYMLSLRQLLSSKLFSARKRFSSLQKMLEFAFRQRLPFRCIQAHLPCGKEHCDAQIVHGKKLDSGLKLLRQNGKNKAPDDISTAAHRGKSARRVCICDEGFTRDERPRFPQVFAEPESGLRQRRKTGRKTGQPAQRARGAL